MVSRLLERLLRFPPLHEAVGHVILALPMLIAPIHTPSRIQGNDVHPKRIVILVQLI